MSEILQIEVFLRAGFYFIGLVLFLIVGIWLPFRADTELKSKRRWSVNLFLSLMSLLTIRALIPFTLVALAASHNGGLFHFLDWNFGVEFFVSLLLLDIAIYWQHRLFHSFAFLWRFHRVHHSDTTLDATTALRFRPIEILISYLLKIAVVMALGIAPQTVIVFEVILNFFAMFNHANFSFPPNLEKWLRYFFVSPDMHRIHHSVCERETNSNFGNFISYWDKLFLSYKNRSKANPATMPLGIQSFRNEEDQAFWKLLMQPWLKD